MMACYCSTLKKIGERKREREREREREKQRETQREFPMR